MCHVDTISDRGNLASGILITTSSERRQFKIFRASRIRVLESCHPDVARACRQDISLRVVSYKGHGLQMPSRSGVRPVWCKCRDCMEQLQT